MKKINKELIFTILFILFVLSLLGICIYGLTQIKPSKKTTYPRVNNYYFTDYDTCVVYLFNSRGLSVRYDSIGKVMIDKECIESRGVK